MNPIPAASSYSLSYDPNKFAARTGEVDLISHKVSTRQGKGDSRITRPLVEFYGATGQGKSWLLAHLHAKFHHDPQSPSPGPFSLLIDLSAFPNLKYSSAFLQALLDQLDEQLGAETIPTLDEKTDATAEMLGKYLRDLGSTWIPVLLFDTADQADDEFLDWIEEHLIYQAIRSETVIFVFASRTRLRWKKFEVRRRVESRELGPFDQSQTGKQIKQLGDVEPPQEAVAALWDYSFGHPLTTRVIYDALCRLNPDAPLDHVEAQEENLAQSVYDLIEKHFLASVEQPELRKLIWDICVLRKFNVAHLREFAGEAEQSEAHYLNLIRDMVASTLVHWSSEDGGYVFDPVVRQILARNLQMRKPNQYLNQHETAAKMYEKWIQEHPRNAGDFMIELAFHRIEIWRAQQVSDNEIASQSAKEFQGQLEQLEQNDEAQWELPDVARALDEKLLKRGDDDLEIALDVLQNTARSFVVQYG